MEKISSAFREVIVKDFRNGATVRELTDKHSLSSKCIVQVLKSDVSIEYTLYTRNRRREARKIDIPSDIDANNAHLEEEFEKRSTIFLA